MYQRRIAGPRRYTPKLDGARDVTCLRAPSTARALQFTTRMKSILLCIGASACASVSPIPDPPSHATSHYLTHLDAPPRAFPVRRGAPELPSANALAEWWRGRELTAHVELCVAPTGDTVHVGLMQSSGERKYDEAVVRDVEQWSYEPFAQGSGTVCEPASITYLP
jgi:hypothetical protein